MIDILNSLAIQCSNGIQGCEEQDCTPCRAAYEIRVLREDAKLAEDAREDLQDTKLKLRICVRKHMRITELLRQSLPENEQVGCGVDGMIQSLLARMTRLAAEKEA